MLLKLLSVCVQQEGKGMDVVKTIGEIIRREMDPDKFCFQRMAPPCPSRKICEGGSDKLCVFNG